MTVMSQGATAPPLTGAIVAPACSCLYSLKGFRSVAMKGSKGMLVGLMGVLALAGCATNDELIADKDRVLNEKQAETEALRKRLADAETFAKDNKKFEILGGAMGETALDREGVKAVSEMPSREELIASIVGCIGAPASSIAGAIGAPASNIASILSTIEERGEAA